MDPCTYRFIDPQPQISVFREASFGHGELEVVNATHAMWAWHRNDDDESVVSDTFWLRNLASISACHKSFSMVQRLPLENKLMTRRKKGKDSKASLGRTS
ncbi:hypothetical protein RJ639_004127 [Escallonia herrerae]|uniref:Purple acid phosphatase C-terminal domain-containing protein n=1 Tax=Escallonia herrerae TaxID=1293975 RepID=A0AA89AXM8_9ASTE|nr:hypothetical protein RJ639_004127 [Escallonia herrerae]